jgi:hypothetical protein
MHTSFVKTMMDNIMEGVMIPKVQIERAVGPIMSMFLPEVLTKTLFEDPVLSGPLELICQEFPLKKQDNRQSTNIDWLMYNTERKQLVFVELKTSDTSVYDPEQIAVYREKQETVRREGGSFLIEDLEQLRDASQESGKYRFILEKKVLPFKFQITSCHDARIIYIVPKSAEQKVQGYADKVLNFKMLSNSITGLFAEEWNSIHACLCTLDDSSRRIRNLQSGIKLSTNNKMNFAARYNFQSIVDLCKQKSDDIIVGFSGGVDSLANKDLYSLENRMYKWDKTLGGVGTKDPNNWIRGSVFIKIIEGKITNQKYSSVPNLKPKHSSHWQATLNFNGMFDLCNQHGDDIIIGFTGGKLAFIRKTLLELQKRPSYKWDYAKNTSGKKQSDWLPGETVIEILKNNHGYQGNRR